MRVWLCRERNLVDVRMQWSVDDDLVKSGGDIEHCRSAAFRDCVHLAPSGAVHKGQRDKGARPRSLELDYVSTVTNDLEFPAIPIDVNFAKYALGQRDAMRVEAALIPA